MDDLSPDPASALHVFRNIRYCELASSVVIVYDHMLTIDQEYHLIWRSPWSRGKCLFLFNRYYSLFTVLFNNYALFGLDHTDMVCKRWYQWQGWTAIVLFIVAELVLQLRLYALYFLDKKVLIFMVTVCLLAAVSSATVMGISLSKLTASVGVIAGSSSCVVHNAPAYFYAFWIPMLASECMLCGLAILRGIQTCFPASTLFQSGRRLVKALVRDAILYFIVVFGVYLVNAIVFIVTTGNELETTVSFTAACSCVLCNRMSLNIRGMVREDNSIPDLTPSPLKNDSSYSSSEIPVEGTESALMEEMHGSQDWREDIVSRV